jgi:superoxide dismutase, Cu-Zn family
VKKLDAVKVRRASLPLAPVLALVAVVAVSACTPGNQSSDARDATTSVAGDRRSAATPTRVATVRLEPTTGHTARGELDLSEGSAGVRISGRVTGLSPGQQHGFHIHELGDCSAADASSAGGHFAVRGDPHGHPDGSNHHAGDLLNLEADDGGSALADRLIEQVTLRRDEPNSILGRAVVVHAQPDDYETQPAGASGARIACGVIEPAA